MRVGKALYELARELYDRRTGLIAAIKEQDPVIERAA